VEQLGSTGRIFLNLILGLSENLSREILLKFERMTGKSKVHPMTRHEVPETE